MHVRLVARKAVSPRVPPLQVAVCNLASLALPMFVGADQTFDFQRLFEVTKVVTRNLNRIIDLNCYPIPEAQASNFRHRPIGIGVQVRQQQWHAGSLGLQHFIGAGVVPLLPACAGPG